jgi:hypothetical protein
MPADMTKLNALVSVLEPASKFSVVSEGEKYVTISSIPSRFHELYQTTRGSANDSMFLRTIKSCFRANLKKRLGFVTSKVTSFPIYYFVLHYVLTFFN